MIRHHGWTPKRLERLPKLLAEGLSAREIAERLGGGITKNAVVGMAHRLDLSFARSPTQQQLPADFVPPPEPVKATPIVIARDPKKDPSLCAIPGCTKTRVRPYPHCQHHDQERIQAKRRAA